MAQVSFDSIAGSLGNAREGGISSSISFFTCKEGEDVVVRFLHDSTQSFDIHTVHEILVNNRPRDYECVRDPHDPVDACPLCASGGGKLRQKIFVHLIKYARNEQGVLTATPCCWVRPAGFAMQLKEFIDNYGPLSELLFRVIRTGQGLDTRYNVMYAPPNMCPPANYPADAASAFEGWTPVGNQIRKQGGDNANTRAAAPANAPTAPYYEAPTGSVPPVGTQTLNLAAAPTNAPAPQAPSAAERFPAARPWNRVQGGGGFPGTPSRPDRY